MGRLASHSWVRPAAKDAEKKPSTGVRPWGWTASGGRFDRLPGVVILELRWAQISESGVQPSGVVDLVDEARKIGGHVFEGLVFHQVDGLDLQRLHKTLGLRIVVGIAASAH